MSRTSAPVFYASYTHTQAVFVLDALTDIAAFKAAVQAYYKELRTKLCEQYSYDDTMVEGTQVGARSGLLGPFGADWQHRLCPLLGSCPATCPFCLPFLFLVPDPLDFHSGRQRELHMSLSIVLHFPGWTIRLLCALSLRPPAAARGGARRQPELRRLAQRHLRTAGASRGQHPLRDHAPALRGDPPSRDHRTHPQEEEEGVPHMDARGGGGRGRAVLLHPPGGHPVEAQGG